jgi:hypothetical protein
VYASGPPATGPVPPQASALYLAKVRGRVVEGGPAGAADPELRVYLADLVRPYGLALREDELARGAGQSYGEMAAALVAELTAEGEPVDLLMLAFAVPDVTPQRATASYLSALCPGEPMAFALCDQGSVAAFTGLRLAREYGGDGGCRRSLLLAAEQPVLHYDPGPAGDAVALPVRSAAVALMCGDSGPARVGALRLCPGTPPGRAAAVLAAELASLPGPAGLPGPVGSVPPVVIMGAQLAPHAGDDWPQALAGAEVRTVPPGQPATGVWSELADGWAGWLAAGRRILVADYDPAVECLALASIEPVPAGSCPGTATPAERGRVRTRQR